MKVFIFMLALSICLC